MQNEKRNRLLIESVRYITGNQKKLKVKGPSRFIQAYDKAIKASRALYEELHKNDPSMKTIDTLVENKNKAAQAFKKITGSVWPF